MTDLTEQWKKGELPDGWYYTEIDLYENRDYIEIIPNTYNDCFEYGIVKQVLAPVPSYEEWQASEKYNKHLEEVIKIYERKDKQATETSIAYNELLEENARLKDVLKTIKRQCELLLPKNGLAPVGDRQRLCRTFFDLIDEVLK